MELIFTFLGIDGYFSCYPSPFSPNWYLVGEWYLGCLVILYSLFPIIHRLQRRSIFGSALTVVGFPALISLATVMAPWVDFTGYLAPGLSCFAAGSFLALLLGDKKPNLGFAVSSLAMLFVSSLLGGSLGKMLMPVVGVGCWAVRLDFFQGIWCKESGACLCLAVKFSLLPDASCRDLHRDSLRCSCCGFASVRVLLVPLFVFVVMCLGRGCALDWLASQGVYEKAHRSVAVACVFAQVLKQFVCCFSF